MPVVLELVSKTSFQQLPISTFVRADTLYKSFINQCFQSSLNATVVQTCLLGQFCPADFWISLDQIKNLMHLVAFWSPAPVSRYCIARPIVSTNALSSS